MLIDVLGKEFELPLAAELVVQESSQAIAALETARERHYVWVRPDGIHCAFVHDKIRSALLERLSAEQRREQHYRVAQLLPRRRPVRRLDLAIGRRRAELFRNQLCPRRLIWR